MLEFPNISILKAPKIYTSHLQEKIESHSTLITFIVFSIINVYHQIRGRLESHLFSHYCQSLESQTQPNQQQSFRFHLAILMFSAFINVFDISNTTFSSIKAFITDKFLRRGYYGCTSIKNLTFSIYSLCKHI